MLALLLLLALRQAFAHALQYVWDRAGFEQVVVSTLSNGLNRRLERAESSQQDDHRARGVILHDLRNLEPIHPRHLEVEHNQIEWAALVQQT